MKVAPLVTISVALATLVSAHYHHKEKDHDSISELESDNAVSQTEDHFAIEKEDQVDEDHKKKKGNDSGHNKKNHTKEASKWSDENEPSNIEGDLNSAETDEGQGKGGKEKTKDGGKKRGKDGEKSDKKKNKKDSPITEGTDQEKPTQDTFGIEQQGEETTVSTTPPKEPGQQAALADTSFDKGGSLAKTMPLSGSLAATSAAAGPPQGSSILPSSALMPTASPSKPAAPSPAATAAGSTIKAGTLAMLALSAFASYYLL